MNDLDMLQTLKNLNMSTENSNTKQPCTIDSVRQRNFLKELTDLCRKHRLEISIDCHSVELTLFDIDEFKNKHPDSANLDDNEYYLNGNYDNFQY